MLKQIENEMAKINNNIITIETDYGGQIKALMKTSQETIKKSLEKIETTSTTNMSKIKTLIDETKENKDIMNAIDTAYIALNQNEDALELLKNIGGKLM